VTVLVGAGQDTIDLLSFFPRTIHIRAGDTITWKQNSDAPHTVSFLEGPVPGPAGDSLFTEPGIASQPPPVIPIADQPGVNQATPLTLYPYPPGVDGSVFSGGSFVSSGRFLGVPPTPGVVPITSFSLTFDKPGVYTYVCLTHVANMSGSVLVEPASSTNVPTPAEIDALAQQQIAGLRALADRSEEQQQNVSRSETGPSGNTIWYVSAGNNDFRINDTRAALQEFFPRNLTVTSGDEVIWGSTGFHSVTFNPTPPNPPLNYLETAPDGSQIVVNNPQAFDSIKPSPIYDPSQFFNSGNLNLGQPSGTAWSLTFVTPGVFEYYCSVHADLGMKGTVTVVAAS